jgi:glycosyltransferase involved in cell wall biosynthesis
MTNVLLDVSAIPPQRGGVGTYVHGLLRDLPAAGVDASVLTQVGDQRTWEGALRSLALVPASRPARLLWEQLLLTHAVQKAIPAGELPPILHSPHYTMPTLVPKGWRPARIVTIHDLTFFTRPDDHSRSKRLLFANAIKRAAKHADALIAVSQSTADALHSLINVRVPVHVIPHGIDHDRFHTSTDDVLIAKDGELLSRAGVPERFILHLGTIEPRKNVHGLLRAYDQLLSERPNDPPALVLAGSAWTGVWERYEPLARDIEQRHRGSRIIRLGEVADSLVAPLYRRSLVVAYPSFEEGFGLPLVESLACGSTVVTSRGSVMHEIANDAIIDVDPNDPGSIAQGLLDALDEQEQADASHRRIQLGTDVAARYRWSECARLHAEAYRSVS